MSNMTAVSTKSMISTSSRRDLNRRRIMRTSLLGPQVEELTIERRADILNDIAGDCIVKIIRAGLKWNRSTWMECKLSWDLVQSERFSRAISAGLIVFRSPSVQSIRRGRTTFCDVGGCAT